MFLEVVERQLREKKRVRIVCLKPRQVGCTSLSLSLMFWLTITRQLCQTLSMSDEDARVVTNFDMARLAWDNLPWWIQPEKRYDTRPTLLGFDRAKEEDRIKSPGLRSQLQFESANQPSGSAYSKSLYGAHMAEVSRYRLASTITEGVIGSLVKTEGSFGIMESTAHGRVNVWHAICKAAQEKRFGQWEFLFIDWFREPGYCIAVPEDFEPTEEENQIVEKVKEISGIDITPGQIAWRREKKQEFEAAGEEDRFPQEFPTTPAEAFVAKGLCAFNKKKLRLQLDKFCRPPNWQGEIRLNPNNKEYKLVFLGEGQGRLKIWEFPKKGRTYYVSGDPSLGVASGDPACAEVFWVPDDLTIPLYQVAEWHGWIGPTHFARVMAALGYLYNTAELSPECNTLDTVISEIMKNLMYPKFYRWAREDKITGMYSTFAGWWTTNRNKNSLIARLNDALDELTIVIRSEDMIEECFDFVDIDEGGKKFEARIGKRDDRVMATMIGYYCPTQFRTRQDSESTEPPMPEGATSQNTDFSMYDDKDSIPRKESDLPSFDTL